MEIFSNLRPLDYLNYIIYCIKWEQQALFNYINIPRKEHEMEAILKVGFSTPLLLRRIQEKPQVQGPLAMSHMTIVTTNRIPEMSDQQDDATRYDKD